MVTYVLNKYASTFKVEVRRTRILAGYYKEWRDQAKRKDYSLGWGAQMYPFLSK
jgi:hypothetical protein